MMSSATVPGLRPTKLPATIVLFRNTAPLLVAGAFVMLAIARPHTAGAGFLLASVPFLLIFVSGVLADLMETTYRQLIMAGVLLILVAYAALTLITLAKVLPG